MMETGCLMMGASQTARKCTCGRVLPQEVLARAPVATESEDLERLAMIGTLSMEMGAGTIAWELKQASVVPASCRQEEGQTIAGRSGTMEWTIIIMAATMEMSTTMMAATGWVKLNQDGGAIMEDLHSELSLDNRTSVGHCVEMDLESEPLGETSFLGSTIGTSIPSLKHVMTTIHCLILSQFQEL
jgi:hypothetical protein